MAGRRWAAFGEALILFVTVLVAGPVAAQTAQPWRCTGNPDIAWDEQIGGCTEAIQSGKYAGAGLVPAYYNRGNAYKAKGDFDRAIADYSEEIRLDPKYALAYNNRGSAFNAKGEILRAVDDQKQFIALQTPKDPWPWIILASYQRDLTQYESALASLRNAEKLDEDGLGARLGLAVYYNIGWTL
jgi:tetratricopeptide (TPR) repeat protein